MTKLNDKYINKNMLSRADDYKTLFNMVQQVNCTELSKGENTMIQEELHKVQEEANKLRLSKFRDDAFIAIAATLLEKVSSDDMQAQERVLMRSFKLANDMTQLRAKQGDFNVEDFE